MRKIRRTNLLLRRLSQLRKLRQKAPNLKWWIIRCLECSSLRDKILTWWWHRQSNLDKTWLRSSNSLCSSRWCSCSSSTLTCTISRCNMQLCYSKTWEACQLVDSQTLKELHKWDRCHKWQECQCSKCQDSPCNQAKHLKLIKLRTKRNEETKSSSSPTLVTFWHSYCSNWTTTVSKSSRTF